MTREIAVAVVTVLVSIAVIIPAAVGQERYRRGQDEGSQVTAVVPGDITIKEGPQIISVYGTCTAEVDITFQQRNTMARVEGSAGSSSCAASRGEYTVVVNFRDANSEQKTLEFVETWERSDDEPVSFMKDYDIGENVDLTRVRLRQLRCTCTELPTE